MEVRVRGGGAEVRREVGCGGGGKGGGEGRGGGREVWRKESGRGSRGDSEPRENLSTQQAAKADYN